MMNETRQFFAYGRHLEISDKDFASFEEILKSVRDGRSIEDTKKRMRFLADDKFSHLWDVAMKLKSTYNTNKIYSEPTWRI